MEVELIEIRQFLEQRNPFKYLSQELLDELPKDIEIRYLRRGGAFPPLPNFVYIMRSGAIEIFDTEGELCEKLGEGDVIAAKFGIQPQLDTLRSMLEPKAQGPGGVKVLASLDLGGARAFEPPG